MQAADEKKTEPKNINSIKRNLIYFEKQLNDRLCGLHCLNSLLQGPFFDAISLAKIAQRLDQLEQELYKEDVDYVVKVKPSGNVDDDGNYNVQVLSEALKIKGAEIESVKQSDCEKLLNESLDNIEAFIFNSSTHWFAIRKIDNIWFNLNSTNPGPGPQIISDFYLSAFIKGTEELGYTNFLVCNLPQLPDLNSDFYKSLKTSQKLVDHDTIRKFKPKKINMGDTDDQALEKAIEMSKKDFTGVSYAEEQTEYKDYEEDLILDDEIKIAMEMSMNDYVEGLISSLTLEPNDVEQHLKITFKTADNKTTFDRRFRSSDKVEDLITLSKIKFRTYGEIEITGMKKNKIYINSEESLEHAGIENGDILIIKVLEF